jgi:hypothetical protein
MKNLSIQGHPIKPIVWIGMGPVAISKLDWNVSMPLKSASSDQLFEWNHAYRYVARVVMM